MKDFIRLQNGTGSQLFISKYVLFTQKWLHLPQTYYFHDLATSSSTRINKPAITTGHVFLSHLTPR